MSRWRERRHETTLPRHCEPPGRANARPMTGSAKQSIRSLRGAMDCFAALAMTGVVFVPPLARPVIARSAATKQSTLFFQAWQCIASLRSQ